MRRKVVDREMQQEIGQLELLDQKAVRCLSAHWERISCCDAAALTGSREDALDSQICGARRVTSETRCGRNLLINECPEYRTR